MVDVKSLEVAVTLATSILFLIPGYLIIKFLQHIQLAKTIDNFELSIQSLIFSLLVATLWIYSPPGCSLRHDISEVLGVAPIVQQDKVALCVKVLLDRVLNWKKLFWAGGWLALITIGIAAFAGAWRYKRFYWKIIGRFFKRFNMYINTWEEFAELSRHKWISVELETGGTYVGVVYSITHYPLEHELILSGSRESGEPIRLYKEDGSKIAIEAEHVLIKGNAIKTIGIFPNK